MPLRARLPLDPIAIGAANAALVDKTDPPGRPLDPAAPSDADLRAAWMHAYADAGGKVDKISRSPTVGTPITPCDHFIELLYLHCDDSPVKNAQYHIRGDGFSANGSLDAAGFVHIDGVPPIGAFTYWFDKDPEVYFPAGPQLKSESSEVRQGATSAVGDVLSWAWGVAEGDFNQDASLAQTAVNMVLGFIPVVDQALDIRDLIAGLRNLIYFYMENPEEQAAHEEVLHLSHETWLWLGLFLIALGCIPEVGSAVKGVAKGLIRKLEDAGRRAAELSPAQIRRLWEELLKILNYLGVKAGNAHEWLKKIPTRLDEWMEIAAQHIRGTIVTLSHLLDGGESAVRRVATRGAEEALDRIRRSKAALRRVIDRLEVMKQRINVWLREQFERVLGGKHHVESGGSVDQEVEKAGSNIHKQQETPPPEPTIPPRASRTSPSGPPGGRPGGHRSAEPTANRTKQDALKLENESADLLASKGYQTTQNPPTTSRGKNPDLTVEGKEFDVLSPESSNVDQIRKGMSRKISSEQAQRLVVNLDRTDVEVDAVRSILERKPIENLEEVIVIKGGNITHIVP